MNEINHNIDNVQEKWTSVAKILQDSEKKTIGHEKRKKRSVNPDIMILSDMQLSLIHI